MAIGPMSIGPMVALGAGWPRETSEMVGLGGAGEAAVNPSTTTRDGPASAQTLLGVAAGVTMALWHTPAPPPPPPAYPRRHLRLAPNTPHEQRGTDLMNTVPSILASYIPHPWKKSPAWVESTGAESVASGVPGLRCGGLPACAYRRTQIRGPGGARGWRAWRASNVAPQSSPI